MDKENTKIYQPKKGDIFIVRDVNSNIEIKCICTCAWTDEYGQHCYTSVRYEE